jgi:hypothetical protein
VNSCHSKATPHGLRVKPTYPCRATLIHCSCERASRSAYPTVAAKVLIGNFPMPAAAGSTPNFRMQPLEKDKLFKLLTTSIFLSLSLSSLYTCTYVFSSLSHSLTKCYFLLSTSELPLVKIPTCKMLTSQMSTFKMSTS